uniref:Uncharacterized protein n=1 Tax=Setaria digitata TaxID=48799 RepID=A0A915PRQ8_9BILA
MEVQQRLVDGNLAVPTTPTAKAAVLELGIFHVKPRTEQFDLDLP